MNDFLTPQSQPIPTQSDDNSLKAELYDEFLEALDILYIKGNLSGRLKFLDKWPDAAHVLFGDELIGYDHDGTTDLERRSYLEDEAEDRRLELLEVVQTLEARSVEKSALQIEFVEALVKKLGRDLALLMYAPRIVDRFIPPPPEPVVSEESDDDDHTEKAKGDDLLAASQKDVMSMANEIVPEVKNYGAPSKSNPLRDEPEKPKVRKAQSPEESEQASLPDPFAASPVVKKPVVPELGENMDLVEPISVDPPTQRPVPEDLQQEPAAPSPIEQVQAPTQPPPPPQMPTSPPPEVAPSTEPEDVFLGRSPYDREDQTPPPPPPPPSQAPSPDPAQHDVTKSAAHKALDDMQPVATQKMTFMPAKKPEEVEKPNIPVIGGDQDKPQD